jgi:AraC-like DNA-binding protein
MIIYFLASLPYLFSPYSYKVLIASAIVMDYDFIWNYNQTILSRLFSSSIMYISRHILVFGYTILSFGMIVHYLMRRKKAMVFTGHEFMTGWLFVLLGLQLIMITSRSLLMIKTLYENSQVFHTLNILQVLSLFGLIGLLISPLFFPAILYGLPVVPEISPARQSETESDTRSDKEESIKGKLEKDYLLQMEQKADAFLQEHQSYLDPSLNLIRFSVLINIPVHHLAYYFKEVKKQSFSDYRNHWRINHAKKLISHGGFTNLTLEAIGSQSGFVTRNTFIKAFKKETGISPREFVSQIRNHAEPD